MNNLQFVQQIYHGRNCYSDSMTVEQIELLHVTSGVEAIVRKMVEARKIVFLTGNPGDGKTFIIKALGNCLHDVFVVTDMNSMPDTELPQLVDKLYDCYVSGKPCVIAANEFPFHKLENVIRESYSDLFEELSGVRKNILVLGCPSLDLKRICIVDLNERNLLDKDRCVVKEFISKFTILLQQYCGSNKVLAHNVSALSSELPLSQVMKIFEYVSMSGQHFVIRDILETVAYMLISCTEADRDSEDPGYYYDALFSSSNYLMRAMSQFDPVLLSKPSLDEKLWNGEQLDGWQFGCPNQWPAQMAKNNGSVEEATQLFKSIKRKFYFENIYSQELSDLQPQDFRECIDILHRIKTEERRIKRMLIQSMNKLFFNSDRECDKLRLWTVHSYDLSRQASAAVSTRFIDASDLRLSYPEPVSWLKEMEYTPACLVMYCDANKDIRLEISMELLRGLIRIKNGYPVSLLSSQYEQEVSRFTQLLCSSKYCRDYPDGEILIANRREATLKQIRIYNNKYNLGNGGGY